MTAHEMHAGADALARLVMERYADRKEEAFAAWRQLAYDNLVHPMDSADAMSLAHLARLMVAARSA